MSIERKMTKAEADRRKAVALAELRELELRQKRGELLAVADVRREWAEGYAALRDRILALPDRLAARLAGRGEQEVRLLLRDELEECLRGLHADG